MRLSAFTPILIIYNLKKFNHSRQLHIGVHTPVCAVSGAKFLTESGWVDLRNPVDTDVPFRLFRDEGRTFLQVIKKHSFIE